MIVFKYWFIINIDDFQEHLHFCIKGIQVISETYTAQNWDVKIDTLKYTKIESKCTYNRLTITRIILCKYYYICVILKQLHLCYFKTITFVLF